jgi:hypothetical protein
MALAACGGNDDSQQAQTTTTAPSHNLSGSVTITESLDLDTETVLELDGGSCTGTGGYDDLEQGAEVVVTDEANKIIGTSSLGEGRISGSDCIFRFVVSNLPRAKFYGVEVSHRGKVTNSYDELVTQRWTVDLSIG